MTEQQREGIYELMCDLVLSAAAMTTSPVVGGGRRDNGSNYREPSGAEGLRLCAPVFPGTGTGSPGKHQAAIPAAKPSLYSGLAGGVRCGD